MKAMKKEVTNVRRTRLSKADQLKNLGAAIACVRIDKGLPRRIVSERSGLSINFLYRVEKDNRQVSLESLQRIAAALQVTIHELEAKAESLPSGVGGVQIQQILIQLEKIAGQPGVQDAIDALLTHSRTTSKTSSRKRIRANVPSR